MRIQLITYTAAFCAFATAANAQSPQAAIETFKSNAVTWDLRNAALLKELSLPGKGEAQLGYFNDNGSFKHPFDAGSRSGVQFNATRANTLSNWSFYGSFNLKAYSEKDVPMTSMANPFRDNPYQIADSLQGKWNKQNYVLSLKAAAPALMNGKLVLGMGLDYEVLTGARQKDPRPLDNSSELKLAPALVYHLNKRHFIGINGNYQHYQENLTVELYNYRLVYNAYKLLGLGEYQFSAPVQLTSGGITRAFSGNQGGGDLQYGFRNNKWNVWISAGYNYRREKVTDGITNPQKAGQHAFHEYAASAIVGYKQSHTTHQWALSWVQRDIDNKEFHQVQNSSNQLYETVYSSVFNTALKTRASLSYLLNKLNKNNQLSWILKAAAGYTGLDNRYANPRSLQIVDKSNLSLQLAKYCNLAKEAAFSVNWNTSYEFVFRDWIVYDNKSYSSNFVAQKMFFPIHGFLSTPSWSNQLTLQYTFPKFTQSHAQLYLKGAGYLNTAMAGNEWIKKGDTRQGFQFTIGLYN